MDRNALAQELTQGNIPVAQLLGNLSPYLSMLGETAGINSLVSDIAFGGSYMRGGSSANMLQNILYQQQQSFFDNNASRSNVGNPQTMFAEAISQYKNQIEDNKLALKQQAFQNLYGISSSTAQELAKSESGMLQSLMGYGMSWLTGEYGYGAFAEGLHENLARISPVSPGYMAAHIGSMSKARRRAYGIGAAGEYRSGLEARMAAMTQLSTSVARDFGKDPTSFGGFTLGDQGALMRELSSAGTFDTMGTDEQSIRQMQQKIKKTSQALASLKDVLGKDVPEIVRNLEGLTGVNALGTYSPEELQNIGVKLNASMAVSGLTMRDAAQFTTVAKTYAARYGGSVEAAPEIARQMGLFVASRGAGMAHLNREKYFSESMKLISSAQQSRQAGDISGAYLIWQRQNKDILTDVEADNIARFRNFMQDENAFDINSLGQALGVSREDIRNISYTEEARRIKTQTNLGGMTVLQDRVSEYNKIRQDTIQNYLTEAGLGDEAVAQLSSLNDADLEQALLKRGKGALAGRINRSLDTIARFKQFGSRRDVNETRERIKNIGEQQAKAEALEGLHERLASLQGMTGGAAILEGLTRPGGDAGLLELGAAYFGWSDKEKIAKAGASKELLREYEGMLSGFGPESEYEKVSFRQNFTDIMTKVMRGEGTEEQQKIFNQMLDSDISGSRRRELLGKFMRTTDRGKRNALLRHHDVSMKDYYNNENDINRALTIKESLSEVNKMRRAAGEETFKDFDIMKYASLDDSEKRKDMVKAYTSKMNAYEREEFEKHREQLEQTLGVQEEGPMLMLTEAINKLLRWLQNNKE